MKDEARLYLEKAGQLLETSRHLAADGYNNDAGRNAYLAGLNAAQAFIAAHTGKAAKTHNGVNTKFAELAREDSRVTALSRAFLSQHYQLKDIADYEVGKDAIIPKDRVLAAIEKAALFLDNIMVILSASP
jgi:uncharacterized protein (UPF0332 family)